MSKVRSWCVEAAAAGGEGAFGEVLFAAFEHGGGEVGDVGGVAEDGHLGDGFLAGGRIFWIFLLLLLLLVQQR